jgi:hypothetical protein
LRSRPQERCLDCVLLVSPLDDAEDLLDACLRLRQEGIVLKRLDARCVPRVRVAEGQDRRRGTNHGPRRLPKELRERIYD